MPTAYQERANQYNAEPVVSTTDAAGAIGKIGFDFGFLATSVAFWNDKADDVYVSLDSTAGSTGGARLKAGENVSFIQCRIGGCSLASTTTSTGTTVRVMATGG